MTKLRHKPRRITARVGRITTASPRTSWKVLRAPIKMVHIFPVPSEKKPPSEKKLANPYGYDASTLPAPRKIVREEVQLHPITQRLVPSVVPPALPPDVPPIEKEPTMPDSKYNKAIMFILAGLVLAGAAYFGLDLAVVFESLGRLLGAY